MSTTSEEVLSQARSLHRKDRISVLEAIPETELHGYLRELFQRMLPDSLVEVTHGSSELGKDLVIVSTNKLTTDVTAVVVKRGTYGQKTAGHVDDVLHAIETYLDGKSRRSITRY